MAVRACSRLTPCRPGFLALNSALQRSLRFVAAGPPNPADRVSWPVRDPTRAEAPPSLPSREREVAAACAALSESVQAGDTAWFERVIIQLRSILLERQSEEAASQAQLAGSTFPTARSTPEPLRPPAASGPTKPSSGPTAASGARTSQPEEPEPPWLEALRLLEAASQPAKGTSRPRAAGHFPARVPPETVPSGEEKLKAYLDSFASEQSSQASASEDGEDPAWARAIRILEAVPVGQGKRLQEKAQPRPAAPEMSPAKGSTGPLADPGRSTRFQSYKRLLQDVPAEPGASLPVRFSRHPSAATPPRNGGAPEAEGTAKPPGVPPVVTEAAPKRSPGSARSQEAPPRAEAVGTGRGHLVSSLPTATAEVEDAELRKEDFVWSEHEFNDGEKENRRVLREFTKEFKKMAEATRDGVRDPKLLTAALDLALACVKCYELDKADAIYRRVIGECRRRGLPWDVKCLQDLATLRCKQHRQADAAELLEELAAKAPPHPATFINLGTVYNQLRQYDRAETWFQQAVNLKGGRPDKDDIWNLAICRKNMGKYDEALPMLQQALAEFQEKEPNQPVTIAKLHSSLGGCLHDMGRPSDAAEEYWKAYSLYADTVGRSSPLFCGAAEGLAKAYLKDKQFELAFEALHEAFGVHARCDSVHTTPLFECLEMALDIKDQSPRVDLASFRLPIEDAVQNLESRGQDKDGNAGLVFSRAGKVLLRSGESQHEAYALQLLRRGRHLIEEAHDAQEANLAHELLEVDLLVQKSAPSQAQL